MAIPALRPSYDGLAPAYELLDPSSDSRWSDFVNSATEASIFHHPSWIELLREQYGYRAFACCLTDEHGQLRAGQPLMLVQSVLTGNRIIGLPFSDACQPLVGGADEARSELTRALDRLRRAHDLPLEVHGMLDESAGAKRAASYIQHRLRLESDPEAVFRRFSNSAVLRGARRAIRLGLRCELRTDRAALDTFYRLHLATRRRHGMVVQPRSFILRLARLFDEGLGFVALVGDGPRTAAAAVFLQFRGDLTYKYGASDIALLSKRPNNLLFTEVIRSACEQGLHTVDFGRTDPEHRGLRFFKASFGAAEQDLVYTRLADRNKDRRAASHQLSASARPLMRRLPLVANRAIGELAYRHYPS